MALSPQLLQYKSSGVYRLEFDKSQTSNIPSETIRLIVGHSKKGPYNSPVLINTVEQFIEVFGNIDTKLEKKGMFFHRSALSALSRGPILALNTAGFTSNDKIDYAAPVTNGSVDGLTAKEDESQYTNFFNTEKFWTPSEDGLNETVGTAVANNLLRFANIKETNLTIIVRKAQDVKAFNTIARDWFGEGNVPAYLNDFDFMSDFMVDVFVFKGSFDPAVMDTDPVYGDFFTTEGLDKNKLDEFANLRQVSLLAKYTGSLLPNFMDKEGNNLYIETIINAEARRTGLFCAIQEDLATDDLGTKIDIVGNTYDVDQDYEVLSYLVDQTVAPSTAACTNVSSAVVTANELQLFATSPAIPSSAIAVGQFLASSVAGEYVEVTGKISVNATTGPIVAAHVLITCDGPINTSYNSVVAVASLDVYAVSNSRTVDVAAGWTYTNASNKFVTFTATFDPTGVSALAFNLKVGQYILSDTAGRLSKIERVAYSASGAGATTINTYTVYVHATAAPTFAGYAIKSFEETTSIYKPFVLRGARVADQSIQNALDAVNLGTGLANALIDKDNITFRYVVDTFGSYANGTLLNKVELSALAKARQNAAAIINAPFISEFKKSTNPSFTDSNGVFQVEYIADGGNLDKNPTALFALPGINDGANYAFYYTALIAREGGKDLVVPSAAYVSNNYIDKYTGSTPWAIVAGPRRGVISGSGIVGAEYAFDKSDRDVLEPFGINPIVFQRGVGLTILGNKTAQQSVQSALSSAHVREVLIYIQDGMAAILKDYVFEFNTAQTRLEIKTLADSFMESVKADFGVYDYKNVMDTTNNTNEVIDANIGILDTFVEPVKGLEIVVHRTTVLNTGEIATGNFS